MAENGEAPATFGPRPVAQADLTPLARLWHHAWHETQAPYVPATLVALRTEPDFLKRLTAMGDRVRTIGPISAPLGFCAIDDDQMDQLFLAADARGTGAGAILLADAETRMRTNGITTPNSIASRKTLSRSVFTKGQAGQRRESSRSRSTRTQVRSRSTAWF